ncbi:MAG: CAP domain-containing protein [Pleurocapsa sp. CRU_1_2]|nr:CAP domain-containing protein [Pleurocapsa sp. CRU_1_2]
MVNNSDTFDQQILDLVNQERAKVGADPLSINQQLDQAADLHSQDQASMNNMTHTGSNGSDAGTRIQGEGYQ